MIAQLLSIGFLLSAGMTLTQPKPTIQSKPTMRVLFVLTSHSQLGTTGRTTGYYLSEVAHPYHVLQQHGFSVEFASIQGGQLPVDGYKLEDPLNKAFVESEAWSRLNQSRRLADVNPADFDAVFFPGGHGTMWDFPGNTDIQRVAAAIYTNGGAVAAVCHGPAALTEIRLPNGSYLVAGKRVAAFTNAEEEAAGLTGVVPFLLADRLTGRGAVHVPAPNWQSNVQVDHRLITGQNPASATAVAEALVKVLQATPAIAR